MHKYEKHLNIYGLIFRCPFGERDNTCPFEKKDLLTIDDKVHWVWNLDDETIIKYVQYHKSCLLKKESCNSIVNIPRDFNRGVYSKVE